MSIGKKIVLSLVSIVIWSVAFLPTLFLVLLLFEWLCSLPGIGNVLSFLAYRIAVKGWVIPLLYIILAAISSKVLTPLIHRIMHDCSDRSVFVTKIICCSLCVLLFAALLFVGDDITIDSVTYYIGLAIGIIYGCFSCEFYEHP